MVTKRLLRLPHRMNESLPSTDHALLEHGELPTSGPPKGPESLGHRPTVIEMQSEGGAAGESMARSDGALTETTFTASQGLWLQDPKHVQDRRRMTSTVSIAARSVAAHALSIFGDHQDVMAVRQTGFGLIASGSVQEATISPRLHRPPPSRPGAIGALFDGFRTSHEVAKIFMLTDDELRALVSEGSHPRHRARRPLA